MKKNTILLIFIILISYRCSENLIENDSFIETSGKVHLDEQEQYLKINLNEESMLWNNGLTKRSWLFLNQDNYKLYKDASNFWDADLVGNPINHINNTENYLFNDGITGQEFSVPNRRSPSVKWVTLGYNYDDWGKYSGYDMWVFDDSSNHEEPIEFRFMNHARGYVDNGLTAISSSRILREIGFVYENWPQYWPQESVWTGGLHSFKDNYKLNQFSEIILSFESRMDAYRKPYSSNNIDPVTYKLGGYVTADFRFNLYDDNGKLIGGYLIGIIFSNPQNLDYNNISNDEIIWRDQNGADRILLDGGKLGVNRIDKFSDIDFNITNSNEIYYKDDYKNVTINYLELIRIYFPNINYENTIITGLDVYSASRGADITFDIKNIELKGIL